MSSISTEPETTEEVRLCPMYKVICHDDPVTTMAFVVQVLREVFAKKQGEAYDLMMKVHVTGMAIVEIVPLEMAEFHVEQAVSKARTAKFPLSFTIEPVE